MNNDDFLIEEELLDSAKVACSSIENSNNRNRAVANVLAAVIAKKYFTDIEIDTQSGLHNSSKLLEELDISDIYIKGNYIDVRLYFDENELCIPKSHYDLNILPVAYMFIKLDENVASGTVTGFYKPEEEIGSLSVNGYYPINVDDLVSHYEVRNLISEFDDIDLPAGFEEKIYDYFDGKVEDKGSFYKILLQSKYARDIFNAAAKAATLLTFIDIPDAQSDTIPSSTDEKQLLNSLEEVYSEYLILEDLPADNLILDEIGKGNSILEETSENEVLYELSSDEDLQLAAEETEINELGASEEELLENSDNENSEDSQELSDEKSMGHDTLENAMPMEEPEQTEQSQDNEFSVLSGYDYTTSITPSLQLEEDETLDESENVVDEVGDEVETDVVTNSLQEESEPEYDNEEMLLEISEQDNRAVSSEDEVENEIDNLYPGESIVQAKIPIKKKGTPLISLILFMLLLGGGSFYAYNKFLPKEPVVDNSAKTVPTEDEFSKVKEEKAAVSDNAMPVETVENVESITNNEEGVSVSIPAIEKNMNASILVSNLSVSWEVPGAYTTNSTAKRYFIKIGKILQLKLKTELMMLSSPPITDKIMLELDFNKNTQHFEIKNLTASSGDTHVDEVIRSTVQSALNMGLNMNMSVFNNIKGNPILIIKL